MDSLRRTSAPRQLKKMVTDELITVSSVFMNLQKSSLLCSAKTTGSFSEFCVCVTDLEDGETQGEEAIPHPLPCPIDSSPDSLPGAAMYRKGGGFGAHRPPPHTLPRDRARGKHFRKFGAAGIWGWAHRPPPHTLPWDRARGKHFRKFGAAGRNSAASWAGGASSRQAGDPRVVLGLLSL